MEPKKLIKKAFAKLGLEIRRVPPFSPDLSVIDYIKEKDAAYLTDPKLLELELLPMMGLNNEAIEEMPEELYRYCGRGLYHWQYPNQLSKYLAMLSQFKIGSYLEIGVHHGGTFILTIEYLNRFNRIRYALGVDICGSSMIAEYQKINPGVCYMLVDSQSSAFREFIEDHGVFDLVFIDGDHTEAACQTDFETVKDRSNICVLHDIASDSAAGSGIVWDRIKKEHPSEYTFYEYTDQYDSVKKRTGRKYLGIGMAVRKNFLRGK